MEVVKRKFIKTPKIALFIDKMALVLLVWIFVSVAMFSYQDSPYLSIWYLSYIFPLSTIVVILALRHSVIIFRAANEKLLVLMLIIFNFAIRLIWITGVPAEPISDFRGYESIANLIASGQPISENLSMATLIQPWGYPVFLGGWYSLLGSSLFNAKLLNLLLGCFTVAGVYLFARLTADREVALIATIFYVMWPFQIAMSNILASEHLALLTLLVAFLLFSKAITTKHNSLFNLVGASIILSLLYIIRPATSMAFVAGILTYLTARNELKAKLKRIAFMLVIFISVYGLFLSGLTLIYRITPINVGGFALLTGTNFDAKGKWNEQDSSTFLSYPNLQAANRYALKEALQRILSNPLEFMKLMGYKVFVTWSDETTGIYYNLEGLREIDPDNWVVKNQVVLSVITQYYHLQMLVLTGMGLVYIYFKHQGSIVLRLILFFLLLGTFLHTILEAQSRYHYLMTPFLMIISAMGVLNTFFGNTSSAQRCNA